MARKQVLVQLDDEMVRELDALAERLDVNRSELIRRSAAALLAADDETRASRAHVDSYRRLPQDPDLVAENDRLARENWPAW